ncbi:MAG: hypothetical protein DRP70_13170 [Spirochaetes bacterium]|nr:MAG: hypothetical protein DRP70_13170 [Spirochaetota bacterium]
MGVWKLEVSNALISGERRGRLSKAESTHYWNLLTTFSISRAKNELTQIIHAVETGPPVELTRHGKAAAVLLSVSDYDALTLKQKVYLRVTDLKFPAGKLIYEPEVSS